ncbi:tRNA(Arg) A34 adenosine deaminase TadA [Mariprofundus ferrinatatus]|uniref:tRNA(Arg) A34 adenosine deaminase TadA n=1 Tax=Mariprofundus ferrinatatus TaxID=1921087 RepID=A0A2K8LEA8_9PROT|nr:nucleoside deaminase [Mariprofundus ferrinatatus]ATX82616.1 tRNA(Arg) A34 adenosine deaminase TadA [Mariprofundus ferrinatatus]
MTSAPSSIIIELPAWLSDFMAEDKSVYPDKTSRMQLAIRLARRNIEQESGGPFGAAIFDMSSHTLLAAGVNLVVPSNCSIAHAEMVAITIAQQKLGSFDLGAEGLPRFELVTSCEPCAMCFGAIPWSGIRHLACGARDEDARAIGFDEGPKLSDWSAALNERGITVETDICRDEAIGVLNRYAELNRDIYNARQS